MEHLEVPVQALTVAQVRNRIPVMAQCKVTAVPALVPALMEAALRQIRVRELTAVLLAAEPNNRVPLEIQRTKILVLKGMCRLLKTDPGLQPNPTVRS